MFNFFEIINLEEKKTNYMLTSIFNIQHFTYIHKYGFNIYSTCLTQLAEYSKFKKAEHLERGRVPNSSPIGRIYYIVTSKKKKHI